MGRGPLSLLVSPASLCPGTEVKGQEVIETLGWHSFIVLFYLFKIEGNVSKCVSLFKMEKESHLSLQIGNLFFRGE